MTPQLLVCLLLLAALGLWLIARQSFERWQRRRRWTRALAAETEAKDLLQELGYEVLAAQVRESYTLFVDGAPVTVSLRADYLVTRNGKDFIAEVKSGQVAPRLGTAATRRQLLEYLVAFQVDGVLLVDGETKRVHEVVFPIDLRRTTTAATNPWFRFAVLFLFIAAIVTITIFY